MDHSTEQWVAALVDALRPALLAQAMMYDRLHLPAPPADELAEMIATDVITHLTALGSGRRDE